MTAKEFEDFLTQSKAQLLEAFEKFENIKDLDIYIKTVLDFQEIVAKKMFIELNSIKFDIANMRGDLLKDSRERFKTIMGKLSENEK